MGRAMVKLTERIPGFTQLDDTTSFYQPANPSNDAVGTLQSKREEPDLLVFCSWMSAAPKHIAKYTAGYQKLFPNTAVLLVEARLGDMFVPNTHAAACGILRSYIEKKQPLAYRSGASIALHACSNGGANSGATLATLLKGQGYAAPFDTVTLDCSPGKADVTSGARAIGLSIPDIFFLRTISTLFIYLFLFGYKVFCEGLGRQNKISWIREVVNDRATMGVNVPRLYLYSKADLLVEAGHVHEHAVDVKRKGCGDVREEVFETAPHCALLNEDAGRYWAAIEKVVRTGSKPFAECCWA